MKKRMTLTRWIRILKSGPKFYKMADLIRLSELSCRSCRVNVHRLVKKGLLIKLGKEFFGSALVPFSLEEAVCQSYLPSYLSCESVLSRHGIIHQMPLVFTAVTTRRTKRTKVGQAEVLFEHIRKNLFWGYVLEGGTFIAEPEKALLDWLYLRKRQGAVPPLDEIHWEEFDRSKLNAYSKRFPADVRKAVAKIAFPFR